MAAPRKLSADMRSDGNESSSSSDSSNDDIVPGVPDADALFFLTHVPMGGEREYKDGTIGVDLSGGTRQDLAGTRGSPGIRLCVCPCRTISLRSRMCTLHRAEMSTGH